MAGVEQLSREQLLVVVAAQGRVIEEQAARIEELGARVAELARRLGQNSGNSSLPPSSDRFAKPAQQRRRPSSRKPGKQPGAPGSALELLADPDEVIDHLPAECAGCGGGLEGAEAAGVIVRQVRDVPLVRVRVIEHRLHKRACDCGAVSTAAAPAGVDAPVCYGPNLRTIAVYLVVFQHVPVERAARLIRAKLGRVT